MWEAFITRRDRILNREHEKSVQSQRKFDTQLQTAQLSAGQQTDMSIDKNLAALDAKVKSIIKETVKSQYIKKESIAYDETLFEDENANHEEKYQSTPDFQYCLSSSSSKRARQPETMDLRSPPYSRKQKADSRPSYQQH